VLTAAATPDPSGRMTWADRDLALAAVLAGTGIRASELCGVRCRDLVADIEDPYVRVVGKGDVTRDCPLPPEVVLADGGEPEPAEGVHGVDELGVPDRFGDEAGSPGP
jgi:hypothetical protein